MKDYITCILIMGCGFFLSEYSTTLMKWQAGVSIALGSSAIVLAVKNK